MERKLIILVSSETATFSLSFNSVFFLFQINNVLKGNKRKGNINELKDKRAIWTKRKMISFSKDIH